MSSEVQKSEQSLSFLVFSNIFLNSIKFYLKVYFCKNKSEAELIYLCGNVLKTLFWFYSLYRNMAKLSQEHFRSLYIHIHNQTHNAGGGGDIDHNFHQSVRAQISISDLKSIIFHSEKMLMCFFI